MRGALTHDIWSRLVAFLRAYRFIIYAVLGTAVGWLVYEYLWYIVFGIGVVSTTLAVLWWFNLVPPPIARQFARLNRYLHLEVIGERVRENRRWLYGVGVFKALVLGWAFFTYAYDSTIITPVVTVVGSVLILSGISYWIMSDRGYVGAIALLLVGVALISARPFWLYEGSSQTACEVVINTEDKPGEREHITVRTDQRIVLDAPWFNLGATGRVEVYEHGKAAMSLYKTAPSDFAELHSMPKPLACIMRVNGIHLEWMSSDTRRGITAQPECVPLAEVAERLAACAALATSS